MIIDLTAQLAPVGMGVVTLLATTLAGIGSCLDDCERREFHASAQRIGAWWLKRGSGPTSWGTVVSRSSDH